MRALLAKKGRDGKDDQVGEGKKEREGRSYSHNDRIPELKRTLEANHLQLHFPNEETEARTVGVSCSRSLLGLYWRRRRALFPLTLTASSISKEPPRAPSDEEQTRSSELPLRHFLCLLHRSPKPRQRHQSSPLSLRQFSSHTAGFRKQTGQDTSGKEGLSRQAGLPWTCVWYTMK